MSLVKGTSLKRVDELFRLARRMRRIALQSAMGVMTLSTVGMLITVGGSLPPVSEPSSRRSSIWQRYSMRCAPPFRGRLIGRVDIHGTS